MKFLILLLLTNIAYSSESFSDREWIGYRLVFHSTPDQVAFKSNTNIDYKYYGDYKVAQQIYTTARYYGYYPSKEGFLFRLPKVRPSHEELNEFMKKNFCDRTIKFTDTFVDISNETFRTPEKIYLEKNSFSIRVLMRDKRTGQRNWLQYLFADRCDSL